MNLITALCGSPRDLFAYANSLMDVDPETVKAVKPINVEHAKAVTVGDVYLVNVGNIEARHLRPGFEQFRGVKITVPLLGDLHDDPEIAEDVGEHWHIDWRFFCGPLYEVFSTTAVDYEVAQAGFKPYDSNLHLAIVIKRSDFFGEPYRKALVCRRVHSLYNRNAPFLPELERMYQSKKVCNDRCPHRGISLIGAPADQHGNRICPGHGLKWSPKGCLVPRTT